MADTVAIYLIDTGTGVDDRTASKMFEAFFSTKPAARDWVADDAKDHRRSRGKDRGGKRAGARHAVTVELPIPARIAGALTLPKRFNVHLGQTLPTQSRAGIATPQ